MRGAPLLRPRDRLVRPSFGRLRQLHAQPNTRCSDQMPIAEEGYDEACSASRNGDTNEKRPGRLAISVASGHRPRAA